MNNNTKNSKYFINLVFQASGRLFSIGANFLIFILAAKTLGTDLFGKFSYIITFLGLSAAISEFGTTSIFSKDISQIKESADVYWFNFLILRISLCLIVMIISAVLFYFFKKDLFIYAAMGIIALPFITSRFFEPLYQVYGYPWYSTLSSVTYGSFYLFFILLTILLNNNLLFYISSYAAANFIYAVFAFFLSLKLLYPKSEFNWQIIKNILKLSWPIGISFLIILINTRADIFMLASLKSYNEVGIYNAAYRFLDLSATLAIIITNPLLPVFSGYAANNIEKLKHESAKLFEIIAIITIPIAVATPYLSSLVINLIYTPEFSPAADVLNIMSWIGILVFFSLFTMTICISIGVVHFGWWNALLAASINVCLNFIWIPKYSYIGSAWATLICEIILTGVSIAYITKYMGNIFNLFTWLKIALANTIFFLFLNTAVFIVFPYNLIAGTILYLVTLFITGLIQVKNIKNIFIVIKGKI